MPKKAGFVLKIFVSLFLIYLVFVKTNLFSIDGRQELIKTATSINPLYLVLSLLVGATLNVVSTWKWWWLLKHRRIHLSFWRVLALYYVGKFYNLFMPTSVGGDVARIYSLGLYTGQGAESAASVIVDRLSGFVTLIILASLSLVLGFGLFNNKIVVAGFVFSIVAVVIFTWMLLSQRFRGVLGFGLGRVPIAEPVLRKFDQVKDKITGYKSHRVLLLVFLFSLDFYMLAVVNVYVTVLAFTSQISFENVSVAVPIIMVLMNLPISIGGIGLMEYSYTLIFDILDLSAALGLSTALLMRAKTLVDAFIGGGIHLLMKLPE